MTQSKELIPFLAVLLGRLVKSGLVLLAACGSTGPEAPFVIPTATGSYTVTLTRAAVGTSPGPSCATVTANLTAGTWDASQCINGVQGSAVSRTSDTLTLVVSSTGTAFRPLKFYGFTGSVDNASSQWSGALCWPDPLGCIREHGSAVWRRQ
jgi:hypothetical protein